MVYAVFSGPAEQKRLWFVCGSLEVAKGKIEKYRTTYGDVFWWEAWEVHMDIND